MKLAFVGGGVMGEAIARGLLARKVAVAIDVTVSDVSSARRDILKRTYGVNVVSDNRAAVTGAEVVLIAVKPQDATAVLQGLKGALSEDCLVISIMAGIKLEAIVTGLNHACVVRAMPNMPALIGESMTVWTATPSLGEAALGIARSILSAIGLELYVSQEKYLDMATAVSGSGPAYVLLFAEALIDAGVHIGLPRDIAQKLALQTMLGSTEAIQQMGKHPAELRNMVTSPGGTTTEGLLELEQGKFAYLVMRAVKAAYEKSLALGAKKA
jgi:pyrroline-5-carboxylate reductase